MLTTEHKTNVETKYLFLHNWHEKNVVVLLSNAILLEVINDECLVDWLKSTPNQLHCFKQQNFVFCSKLLAFKTTR